MEKVKVINDKICFTTSTLCEVLNVKRTTLKRWADDGCPKESVGWWPIADVLRWKGLVGANGVNSGEKLEKMGLNQQKLFYEMKYKEAQAENMNFKNEIERGVFIRREEVTAELSRFFITLKRSIGGISRKIANEISAFVDPTTCRRIERQLEDVLQEALYQLSVDGVYEAPKKKKVKG